MKIFRTYNITFAITCYKMSFAITCCKTCHVLHLLDAARAVNSYGGTSNTVTFDLKRIEPEPVWGDTSSKLAHKLEEKAPEPPA